MLRSFFFLLALISLVGCQNGTDAVQNDTTANNDLMVNTADLNTLTYDGLHLVPVTASESFIKENKDLVNLQTLDVAIENPRFRISEKKPYGRFEDRSAVNTLTVQNKSEETVFLMAGDIVEGGNQDRVIAQNVIIKPNTIQDVQVFCVEPNRWSPRESDESPDKNFAFTGYYHVASSDLRNTMRATNNQGKVWAKVNEITTQNDAVTGTGTYAALADAETFNQKKLDYLRFFEGKFEDHNNIVGLIAVNGNEIIATDIFGHPDLFQAKLNDLLHSYTTDVINRPAPATTLSEEAIKALANKRLAHLVAKKANLRFGGQ